MIEIEEIFMFKVRDSDNIFLLLMKCIAMVENDSNTKKISKIYYKAWCNVCMFTVTAKYEITAKRAILAHIVSQHRDKWLNHEGNLVEEK
jgi:hypothetical protein